MTDIKELEALLKLCRKQGVTEIDMGDVKIKFGDLPVTRSKKAEQEEDEMEDLDPLTGLPKAAFYSSDGPM